MQMMQHSTEHAKQVNDMNLLTVLRKISIQFRHGQVKQILFLTVQKQKFWSYQLLQMPKYYQLKKEKINVKCNNVTLERASE